VRRRILDAKSGIQIRYNAFFEVIERRTLEWFEHVKGQSGS